MDIKKILFPIINRNFWGKRWGKVVLLNLHLIGVCGYVGGKMFSDSFESYQYYFFLTMLTGMILVLIELYSNLIWVIQNRGWMILAKIVLLSQIYLFAPYEWIFLLLLVFVSGWISHAKGSFRYYSVIHGKIVDSLEDLKNKNSD
jgi:hypothetical protein